MFRLYDKEAYELLKKCSDKEDMTEWNEYRKKTGNQKVNLRFANLRWFYMQGANLKNTDFRFASLNGSDMLASDVENAKLATYAHYVFLTFCFAAFYAAVYFMTFTVAQDQKLAVRVATATAAVAATAAAINAVAAVVVAAVAAAAVVVAAVAAVVAVVATVATVAVVAAVAVVAVAITVAERTTNLKAIGRAKNPETAIGFDQRYKQTDISAEIEKLEQKAQEITDEEKRNEILQKIESLKQQKTIEKAIESLKKPYKYLEDEIKKLRVHNYFFYALIVASISIIVWYGMSEYQNRDGYMGVLFGDVKSVDFGSILGISLFYGTPIIFLTFVIVYAVSQINKNIDKAHELSTQKHYIEILASAFNSKTEAGATDEEIQKDLKMAADTIRDATIAKMLGKEKKEEDKESTKKDRYRETVDAKAAFALFSTMLKNSK